MIATDLPGDNVKTKPLLVHNFVFDLYWITGVKSFCGSSSPNSTRICIGTYFWPPSLRPVGWASQVLEAERSLTQLGGLCCTSTLTFSKVWPSLSGMDLAA